MTGWAPLRRFVTDVEAALDSGQDEAALLARAEAAMADLVASSEWLPPEFAQPDPAIYRQYLLYRDPASRFSVVSFVWGPGQKTPVHNHTVWGVIGQLIGSETSQRYRRDASGALIADGPPETLRPGQVASVAPFTCDIHRVENPSDTDKAISIHAYGGDIGRIERHVFDPMTGQAKSFISSYSNLDAPDIGTA